MTATRIRERAEKSRPPPHAHSAGSRKAKPALPPICVRLKEALAVAARSVTYAQRVVQKCWVARSAGAQQRERALQPRDEREW